MSEILSKANPCPSCKGDMYHYAGCGIGEHGDRTAAHPPTDTRQAVDAARSLIEQVFLLAPISLGITDAYLADFEAAVRADERARIGAASQDETENRP